MEQQLRQMKREGRNYMTEFVTADEASKAIHKLLHQLQANSSYHRLLVYLLLKKGVLARNVRMFCII